MATAERYIIESMLMIADKEGNDVPFILNSAQQQLDTDLTGRDIIPKARQEGISSYYQARALVKCLSHRNTKAVIISHEEKATQRMLQKIHYMISHIRGPQPIIKNMSANAITFPKMDSMIYVGTAGAKKFGRGDTINFLHCSEVAYWPDPKGLTAGLFQAVPKSGEIAIESTGNGKGNWYHRRVMRAASGESRYRLHFFDWQSFEEYCFNISDEEAAEVMASLQEDLDEPRLVEQFGLTAGQILWRRDKIDDMDYDVSLFQQEYPMTLDECFQSTGRSIFYKINYEATSEWQRISPNLHILKGHPNKRRTYVIGADVAAGIGGKSSIQQNEKKEGDGDRSVIEIVCLDTMEQVGEYVNNSIAPDAFASKIKDLAVAFGDAFVVVENNNHGILTLSELRKIYPTGNLYKKPATKGVTRSEVDKITDMGFRTSVKSKPYAVGLVRMWVAKDLIVHSPTLVDEMYSFIEHSDGSVGAEDGCFDDRVMAMAMLCVGLNKAMLMKTAKERTAIAEKPKDEFSLDSILKEMHGRKSGGYPISPQHAEEGGYTIEDFSSL